ncbi:MAG: hypothetical protein QXZ25_03475 [Candidatus Bathyarchaeia archaeon]
MERRGLVALVENFGGAYSETLGINLTEGKEEEIFKWFLAALLFGAPITEGAAIKTYKCFCKYNILTPKRILETEWDGLVKILDEGSYTRYDFKTADKLLEVARNLMDKYNGSLNLLHESASDAQDLERRLKDLGKGIGDVTISIFLRELRGIWGKADPKPTELVILAARKLGIVEVADGEAALKRLREFWDENKVSGKSFVNFETALLRLGKDFCRRGKCSGCIVKDECLTHEAT